MQSRSYLLTPWCRVLLEKLAGLQLVKKFPAFYGTRKFITAFTSFRHPSLSWASPIQSPYPQPTSWRSILILSTHLRLGLPSGLFPSVTIELYNRMVWHVLVYSFLFTVVLLDFKIQWLLRKPLISAFSISTLCTRCVFMCFIGTSK